MPKLCPLKKIEIEHLNSNMGKTKETKFASCDEAQCAWWNPNLSCCSMRSISALGNPRRGD